MSTGAQVRKMTVPNALLAVSGLSKTFPSTRALDGFDLSIQAGKEHGLLGRNGSGKSTLIKTLTGIEQPGPGAIVTVNGLFNAWGTLLAIILLGTLDSGLASAGVPTWVPLLSTGSVLIIASAIGQIRERDLQFTWGVRVLRPRPPSEIVLEASGAPT